MDLSIYRVLARPPITSEVIGGLGISNDLRYNTTRNRVIRICIQNTLVPPIAGYF